MPGEPVRALGAPDADATHLTVAGLLGGDAASVATLIAGGEHAERVVVATEFFDVGVADSIASGVLVLVPSWSTQPAHVLGQLVELAASRRAAGIAVQGVDPAPVLERFGTAPGVPIVLVCGHLTWRQFEAIVERAVGERAPGLTASVLQPDALYAIADAVAEVFGGSVAVEDHARTLLAYSTLPGQVIDEFRSEAVRTRKVPDVPRNRAQYHAVLRAPGPVRFPRFDHELPRAAIAIRAGSLHLGTIWAIDPDGDDPGPPLAAAQHDALVRGAQQAAAHLLAVWRVTDADAHRREGALARLLDGVGVGDEPALLCFDHDQAPRVAAARFDGDRAGPGDVRQSQAFIERQLRARGHDPRSAVDAGTCYLTVDPGTESRLVDDLDAAVRAADRVFAAPLRAAVSSGGERLERLHVARREVDAVLGLARDLPHRVATNVDVRSALLVLHFDELLRDRPYLRHPVVTDPSDSRKVRDLRATLLDWLECGRSAPAAAARRRVHENTVRYRLQQAVDRWQLRLDDPDEAFALWASLAAVRARARAAGSGQTEP